MSGIRLSPNIKSKPSQTEDKGIVNRLGHRIPWEGENIAAMKAQLNEQRSTRWAWGRSLLPCLIARGDIIKVTQLRMLCKGTTQLDLNLLLWVLELPVLSLTVYI